MRIAVPLVLLSLAACQSGHPPAVPTVETGERPQGPAGAPAQATAPAPDYPVLDKLPDDMPQNATVQGKYSGLIRVVPAADENQLQGGFRDLGCRDVSPTPKVTDLAGACWVYAAPNWYAWKTASEAPLEAPPGVDASGKYTNLLKRFAALDDLAEYGTFFDAGFRRQADYKGIRGIPAGYWVYDGAYWYVWADARPLPLEAPEQARVNGTYDRLLRIVPAPDDAARHGAFADAGRLERPVYKGVYDIPAGYWVYVKPNWYVWGVNTRLATEPTE